MRVVADIRRLQTGPAAAIHRLEVEPMDGGTDVPGGRIPAGPQGSHGGGDEHQGGVPGVRPDRDTVRKMTAYSVPPGCRRQNPPRRPKLEPFTGVIDAIL